MSTPTFRSFVVCLLLVASAVVFNPAARAQTVSSDLFASAQSAFERDDFASALVLFRQALAAGSTGPAVHYNIAVCEYRLGDFAAAERSFRALAADYPELRELAEYNLGLTLVESDRRKEAVAAFQRASGSDDHVVAELAQAMLARLRPPERLETGEPRLAWTRLVETNIGHDDNVALVEASSLPAGRSTDSAYADAFIYFGGPLSRARRWAMDASAFLVRYADASEYDQQGLSLGAAYSWRLPVWRLELGPRFSYTTLDGDGLEQRLGVGLRIARPIAERGRLEIRLAHDDVAAIASRFDYLEGSRDAIAVEWGYRLKAADISAAFGRENNDRLGAGVSSKRDRWTLKYARALGPDWGLTASIGRRNSDYSALTTPRSEALDELRIAAARDVGRAWQLKLEIQLASNEANDPSFVYDRHRLAAGLSRLF